VVARDDPCVQAARAALADVLGTAPPDRVFPGTTDAAGLPGLLGIPTLPALGPGLLERAHRADEFVRLPALAVAPAIYARLAATFCQAGP
jgi:succinyl-diaminopimelate desuccinylase